ncbi:cGMP-dependent protein kinase [Aureococcus anophagefferens]|nr:cGMP-dependent protein kinase [Aureococcus anophagefferens]
MPQRSAAEQRKVDRKVAKRAEEAAECKRLKDEHDDFKNSDAAPGPHRDKKLKKLYDDWYDYYAATDNGKRQIKREEQNSLSNNLHKKLEAARGDDTLRPTTKKQKVDDLVAQAAAAKEKTHAAEQKTRDDAKRQKVIDLRADACAVAADASLAPWKRRDEAARLEKQAVAAEEDTPAAQKRRWTEARTARTLLELEEYLEDELCGDADPDHVFLLETAINGQEELMAKRERWQDQRDERRRVECAVELLKDERTKIMAGDEMIGDRTDPWHVASYDQGIAALEEFLKPSARPAAAQRERERRRAATATHKALADELAVLLDDEDADEDDVADLTARVQAAEEDTPAAQQRRWRRAATATHKALADELAAAEEDTPAAQQRRWRRAATATHKALADELAVLLDDEDADEDDVADLTARVQAAWLKTGAGYYAARALADLEAEIRASAGTQKVPPGEILESARAIARAVVDYCLQEIRAGRRVYIGNARYAQMLKEAKCVPRRKCSAVKGPRGGALPWDRFFFKSFDRIAETVVGNVAEKYAMNLLANHEDVELDDFAYDRFGSGGVHHDEALGDTGLYVLSLEPRATDTTRPSRYILGREVKFSAEFEAELKGKQSPAGMPTSARKGDLDVYMQDFSAEGSPVYRVYTRGTWTVFTYKRKPDSPFNGPQKFKWGSSAVARAKAQAKIDEKSVKGNYVVVGSDSWV